MTSFMRILNLERIVFLMCIVSSWEITWGTKNNKEDDKAALKEKIKVEKLGSDIEKGIDRHYKVVFLGDTNVGKTQILNKHVKNSFENQYSPTIGGDYMNNKYQITNNEGNKFIQLQICDTSGDEKYKIFFLKYIQDERAIVLVYDVTQKESFKNIKNNWLKLAKNKAPQDAVYFLVCNKTDLGEEERKVKKEEAEKFAKENDMRFFEVSATNSNTVDKLFEDIVKECLIKDKNIIKAIKEYEQKNNTNDNDNSTVNGKKTTSTTPSPTPTKNKRCSCCPCNKEK